MAWTELANSQLNNSTFWSTGTVYSSVLLPFVGVGTGGKLSTIDAWVSGDYDTTRGIFTFPATGGHNDWALNQVLGYTPSSSWHLLRAASSAFVPQGSTAPASSPKNLDGTPASKHTYCSIIYMPTVDRFWCGGGIYWWDGGSTPQTTWWWDPNTGNWAERATRPGGYGVATCWDPNAQVIYLRTSAGFYSYNPLVELSGPNAAAYTLLFSQTGATIMSSPFVLDSVNRRLYRISPRDASNPTGGLKMIDLNNLQAKEVTLNTAGDTQIETGDGMSGAVVNYGPGLIFADNRLIGMGPSTTYSTATRNGEWAVYTLVPPITVSTADQLLWLRDTSAPGAQPPFAPASTTVAKGSRGLFNKFFATTSGTYYVIAANGQSSGNVWTYTPSWTATQNILDQVTDVAIQVTT